MSDGRVLRIVTSATFLPAFPLCLAHGVVSHSPVPAVGLVPLAFSAGTGIFLLARGRAGGTATAGEPAAVEEGQAEGQEGEDSSPTRSAPHPLIVFAADVVLAVALMVVLVFTWIRTGHGQPAQLAMLASYATIPLLINFLIHLYLAVRELSRGLALHGLMQWVAWQAVPPDCPNCSHRLRPASPPRLPWLESLPRVTVPAFPAVTVPALPAMRAPEWKVPEWLRWQPREYNNLFVDDAEERYRDEPDEGEPSTRVEVPEASEVRPKDRKAKNTPLLDDE
ncbi:hypothetical protein GQ53DRAFT_162765 [Thozetella sp. PMI_491]|nr:hypothetical protein GQ53DRAFT_162765 [Thozetella sp. PMI_491]